jgi:hypothetical protein
MAQVSPAVTARDLYAPHAHAGVLQQQQQGKEEEVQEPVNTQALTVALQVCFLKAIIALQDVILPPPLAQAHSPRGGPLHQGSHHKRQATRTLS